MNEVWRIYFLDQERVTWPHPSELQNPTPPFFSRCWQWRASGVPSTLDLLDLAYNVLLPKISKDSSQPACCFSFWDSPKDLQGYLDPRGAAKHGRMPRERWQRLISQSVSQSRKTNLSILAVASHISLPKTCYCTRQSKTAPSLLFEKYSKTTRISLRKEQQNTEVGRVSGVSFNSNQSVRFIPLINITEGGWRGGGR